MRVLTTEEFDKKKTSEKTVNEVVEKTVKKTRKKTVKKTPPEKVKKEKPVLKKSAEVKKKKPVNVVDRSYIFEPAPMGNSSASFYYTDPETNEKKEITINLIDKVFVIPGNWDLKKRVRHEKMLLLNGFKETTVINNDAGEKILKVDKEKVYKLGHPENTDTLKINGKVSAHTAIGEILVDCVNGIIRTVNKDIFDALLKQGFYHITDNEYLEV